MVFGQGLRRTVWVMLGGSVDSWTPVDLIEAAGRFLREVHGEPVANLRAVLVGGESSEPSLEQRLRAVEGLVQDHETAIPYSASFE